MTSKHLLILFCFVLIFICLSCNRKKKETTTGTLKNIHKPIDKTYLHLNNGLPAGIIRLECSDCELVYHINKKKYKLTVSNGNQDIFFYPKSNTRLLTDLRSNIKQMIRLAIFDPNGNIVVNNLAEIPAGQTVSGKFTIGYEKPHPKVVLIKTKIKDLIKPF